MNQKDQLQRSGARGDQELEGEEREGKSGEERRGLESVRKWSVVCPLETNKTGKWENRGGRERERERKERKYRTQRGSLFMRFRFRPVTWLG